MNSDETRAWQDEAEAKMDTLRGAGWTTSDAYYEAYFEEPLRTLEKMAYAKGSDRDGFPADLTASAAHAFDLSQEINRRRGVTSGSTIRDIVYAGAGVRPPLVMPDDLPVEIRDMILLEFPDILK